MDLVSSLGQPLHLVLFIEYFIVSKLVLEVLEGEVQEVGRSAFGEGQLIGNDVEVFGPGVGHLGGQCGQITV